jgi:hypothetical protein
MFAATARVSQQSCFSDWMSLPAIHTITAKFIAHAHSPPDDMALQFTCLYHTSSLERLALHHCKIQSSDVLKDILSSSWMD